jgi:hypothetical protein
MMLRTGGVPDELVLFTIEVADTGHGIGLTPQVARAVPKRCAWRWPRSGWGADELRNVLRT